MKRDKIIHQMTPDIKLLKNVSSNRRSAAFVTKAKLWKSHIIMHVCVFFSRHIWGNWQLSLLNTTTLLALLGNLNNCLLLVSLHFADIFKTCHHQSILNANWERSESEASNVYQTPSPGGNIKIRNLFFPLVRVYFQLIFLS